jgi:hypothetical protein
MPLLTPSHFQCTAAVREFAENYWSGRKELEGLGNCPAANEAESFHHDLEFTRWLSEALRLRVVRGLSREVHFRERLQLVSAAVSRLKSDALSIDFTSSMTDSAFCAGHLANLALPLNLSATSS